MTDPNGRANGSAIDNRSEQVVQTIAPEGWRQGCRPEREAAGSAKVTSSSENPSRRENHQSAEADRVELVRQIEAMEKPLGKGLYRGLLKTMARVWRPSQVQDSALLRKLLAHMNAAERGLRRLEAAVGCTGPDAMARILESVELVSVERVDSLETLKEIVLSLKRSQRRPLANYKLLLDSRIRTPRI